MYVALAPCRCLLLIHRGCRTICFRVLTCHWLPTRVPASLAKTSRQTGCHPERGRAEQSATESKDLLLLWVPHPSPSFGERVGHSSLLRERIARGHVAAVESSLEPFHAVG